MTEGVRVLKAMSPDQMLTLVERIKAFGWPVPADVASEKLGSLGWTHEGASAYLSGDGFNEPQSSGMVQAGQLRSVRCPLTDSATPGDAEESAQIVDLFAGYVRAASLAWGQPGRRQSGEWPGALWFLDNDCSVRIANWGRGVSLEYNDPDLTAIARRKRNY